LVVLKSTPLAKRGDRLNQTVFLISGKRAELFEGLDDVAACWQMSERLRYIAAVPFDDSHAKSYSGVRVVASLGLGATLKKVPRFFVSGQDVRGLHTRRPFPRAVRARLRRRDDRQASQPAHGQTRVALRRPARAFGLSAGVEPRCSHRLSQLRGPSGCA